MEAVQALSVLLPHRCSLCVNSNSHYTCTCYELCYFQQAGSSIVLKRDSNGLFCRQAQELFTRELKPHSCPLQKPAT